jgi:hypothetical protein
MPKKESWYLIKYEGKPSIRIKMLDKDAEHLKKHDIKTILTGGKPSTLTIRKVSKFKRLV